MNHPRIVLSFVLFLVGVFAASELMAAPDLLIITPKEFVDELQPLQQHKNETGIATEIIDLDSVYATYIGADAQAQIKACIKDYFERHKTLYFMLVGDGDRFPVRYCSRNATEPRGYQPCDVYYSSVREDFTAGNLSWDGNGNGIYAEMAFGTDTNNLDAVDWMPEVAVGRVPASTAEEVATYVAKIIRYEFNSYRSSWSKKAVLAVDGGASPFGSVSEMEELVPLLAGFEVIRRYKTDPAWSDTSTMQATQEITSLLNEGAGFFVYFGHGGPTMLSGWYHMSDLSNDQNADELPILVFASCDTGLFAPFAPTHTYNDVDGNTHIGGTEPGEDQVTLRPAGIQTHSCDRESHPEHWLTSRDTGAVAVLAPVGTGNPPWTWKMVREFFEGYSNAGLPYRSPALGLVWRSMVRSYVLDLFDSDGNIVVPEEDRLEGQAKYVWHQKAIWNMLLRFTLFGDPSLRIGGVSSTVLSDFLGTYTMYHSNWEGTLTLEAVDGDTIEGTPNITGEYVGLDGSSRKVRGYARTWDYPLNQGFGPDHMIRLAIDFAGTAAESDDQVFNLYLVANKSRLVGTYAWQGVTFGVVAEPLIED
jgi:hypothetical protein